MQLVDKIPVSFTQLLISFSKANIDFTPVLLVNKGIAHSTMHHSNTAVPVSSSVIFDYFA